MSAAFVDSIQKLAERVRRQKEDVRNEDVTKRTFVLPFIRALGYDDTDPVEVDSEFIADVGVRKYEKVDYAIVKSGKPILLVECKSAGTPLEERHLSQLTRYYGVTDARFAILTNGIVYQFFSDFCKRNVMDETPFLVFDMLALDECPYDRIKRFSKSSFNAKEIWDSESSRAKEESDFRTITSNIEREFKSPSEGLVKLLARCIPVRWRRRSEKKRVTRITKRALALYLKQDAPIDPPPEPDDLPDDLPDFSIYNGWDRASEELKAFFMQFYEECVALGEDVRVEPVQSYISFKRNRNIADVLLRSRDNYLTVYVFVNPDSVPLREGFTRDVREIGHVSPNPLEITIRNHVDLESAKQLLLQSYQQS